MIEIPFIHGGAQFCMAASHNIDNDGLPKGAIFLAASDAGKNSIKAEMSGRLTFREGIIRSAPHAVVVILKSAV